MAFDILAGARMIKLETAWSSFGLVVIILEALLYCLVFLGSILFLFTEARRELPGRETAAVTGFVFVYTLPYILSFSHPTYHLPILPLLLLLGSVWGHGALVNGIVLTKWPTRWLAWLILLLAVGIQVEWLLRMQ